MDNLSFVKGQGTKIVAKFGGTSLADAATILKSMSIVQKNPAIKVIVVSAIAGITNLLVELWEERDIENVLKIIQVHQNICKDLNFDEDLNPIYEELLRYDHRDALLSVGERLSSKIVTHVLKQMREDVFEMDVRKVLVTDDQWGKANPQIAQISEKAKTEMIPSLEMGKTIVTQGFIGKTLNGETTTLGRGGSDYSAALLAEAIHAETLQIWTDVPGIFTLDPRISEDAIKIDELNVFEAAELANFGAKVLHPQTLSPVIRSNTPIYVGSSLNPHLSGTWIHKQIKDGPEIRAIAIRRNQTLVTLKSFSMLNAYGFLAKIFRILAEHHLVIDVVTTSEVNVALTLNEPERLTRRILDELEQHAKVSVEYGLSLIAIIGNEMTANPGIATEAFCTLQEQKIRLICQGASNHNLCFLVENAAADAIAKSLHDRFILRKEYAL